MSEDPVVTWVTGRRYDPQERLHTLMHAQGHVLGPWSYCGTGPWVAEGTACAHCGLPAFYGRRRKPGARVHYVMAVWGAALTTPCTAQTDAAL